eukprot:GHVN01028553.1.p1 GENE.GHVN01028553.1~~GHVN01028553.1.p1  ORF type:complete len:165 (+),score=14.15 GHVN01028553.1:519-1013(+)
MSNENISCLGIGRIRDQALLATVFDRISAAEKNEIESAFAHFLLDTVSRFGPGSREKRVFGSAQTSTMYLVADKKLIAIYAVAVRGVSYPDWVAFALVEDMIRTTESTAGDSDLNNTDPGRLTKPLRKPFKELMDKYDNPAGVDKASEVAGKVDNVKITMQVVG